VLTRKWLQARDGQSSAPPRRAAAWIPSTPWAPLIRPIGVRWPRLGGSQEASSSPGTNLLSWAAKAADHGASATGRVRGSAAAAPARASGRRMLPWCRAHGMRQVPRRSCSIASGTGAMTVLLPGRACRGMSAAAAHSVPAVLYWPNQSTGPSQGQISGSQGGWSVTSPSDDSLSMACVPCVVWCGEARLLCSWQVEHTSSACSLSETCCSVESQSPHFFTAAVSSSFTAARMRAKAESRAPGSCFSQKEI
jgi:hypothetical protein